HPRFAARRRRNPRRRLHALGDTCRASGPRSRPRGGGAAGGGSRRRGGSQRSRRTRRRRGARRRLRAGGEVKLAELGELGLLAELERRGLARGIEHDAAELAGGLVVTQDALVEGVHFLLDRMTWRDLGFRAAAVNLSDLAASGATPDCLVVTLGAPGETEADD